MEVFVMSTQSKNRQENNCEHLLLFLHTVQPQSYYLQSEDRSRVFEKRPEMHSLTVNAPPNAENVIKGKGCAQIDHQFTKRHLQRKMNSTPTVLVLLVFCLMEISATTPTVKG